MCHLILQLYYRNQYIFLLHQKLNQKITKDLNNLVKLGTVTKSIKDNESKVINKELKVNNESK